MEEIQLLIQGVSTLLLLSPITFLFLPLASSMREGHNIPFITGDIEQVSGRSFDYIIVGGGTSGCPLAATLSKRYSVLLVERGRSPYGDPLIEEQKNFGLPILQTDEFTSVAQAFVSEEGVPNHRGRALGGSTTINGGFYSRASEDFVERAGWDKELVRDSYEWVESKVVFRPQRLTPFESAMKDAMVEAGIRPFNGFSLEHIKGTKIGGSIFDGSGTRHTAADLLRAGDSKKITVLLNATVQNVIFHNYSNEKKPRACGIRFIKSNGRPTHFYEAYLSHRNGSGSWGDVVLSAGALGSPQILMLSGIGPWQHLNHFNITLLIDGKDVGRFMQDNPGIRLNFNVSRDVLKRLQPMPLPIVGIANSFHFVVQIATIPTSFNSTATSVISKIANPSSRGSLKLQSTDPRQNPSVKFNYLAKEKDLDECVEMANLIEKVAQSKSVQTFVERQQPRLVKYTVCRDEYLRDFCKKNVETYYHYHGGCVVGSVVDKDYRVFGVEGLRVVDGSTFLKTPGTNPMATLLMLGRYQGIKMLGEREDV